MKFSDIIDWFNSPQIVSSSDVGMEFFKDPTWIYDEGNWSERKYEEYLRLRSIYPVKLWMDYLLDKRDAQQYLDNHGLDWSDIRDPRKFALSNSGSALYGYSLNFVSDNVKKLYR